MIVATNKYKMFWLYRLYKEPSPKARERFPDIQHSTDRTYLVWKDGEVFKSKELLPVQPVRENVSVDIPDEIKAKATVPFIPSEECCARPFR